MDRRVPRSVKAQSHRKDFIAGPALSYVLGVAIEQTIKSIVGYIAIWFFRPVWDWFLKKWNSRTQKNTEVPVDSTED